MHHRREGTVTLWRATVALGLVGAAAIVWAQVATPPPAPRVTVSVHQKLAFEAAHFVVSIETPGCRLADSPRVRPYYGRADLMPDSVTSTGFAFLWDVPGAIRAARGPLRRTKIYIHWTMRPDAPPDAKGTPMLTAITVSLSPTGLVTETQVHTAAAQTGPVFPPTATQPVTLGPSRSITSAVCQPKLDEQGTLRLQVWVVGDVRLVGRPHASANLGHARATEVPGAPDRIEVEWRRPEREMRDVVPVNLVVTWTARAQDGQLLSGRTVVDLITGRTAAGVAGVSTTTSPTLLPASPTTAPAAVP